MEFPVRNQTFLRIRIVKLLWNSGDDVWRGFALGNLCEVIIHPKVTTAPSW